MGFDNVFENIHCVIKVKRGIKGIIHNLSACVKFSSKVPKLSRLDATVEEMAS